MSERVWETEVSGKDEDGLRGPSPVELAKRIISGNFLTNFENLTGKLMISSVALFVCNSFCHFVSICICH
ncbi:hypothetical protein COLO4_06880 [Corchorus olitorius]|uniref:Uncharacterized protein n=1 Tax=Corchorus olitorius TaxID=93759 RepID=A0A1R3KLL6_9ROSI|nr:hypothetical protein COLO4_06880 [Corchorus olitorius]